MANTTFNGPVRAEQGFKQISKNATTGAITDQLTVDSSGNLAQTAGVNNLITDVENLTAATKTVTAAGFMLMDLMTIKWLWTLIQKEDL
jgi:hypothetical protein